MQGGGGQQHPKDDDRGAYIAAWAIACAAATFLHLLILDGENGFFISGKLLVHVLRVQHSTKVPARQLLSPEYFAGTHVSLRMGDWFLSVSDSFSSSGFTEGLVQLLRRGAAEVKSRGLSHAFELGGEIVANAGKESLRQVVTVQYYPFGIPGADE